MQKDNINQGPSGRPKRQPVGSRNRLTLDNKDPNFEYRFVNDVDDRVAMFQNAGYEIVDLSKHKVGHRRMDNTVTSDNNISVGGGTKAVAMRIRKDWYQEDQKEKQYRVDESERGLKTPQVDGSYGKIEITRS